ncbi:epoxide hydrolase 1 [Candidatus Pelagibacter sp.]|nr:epoxide hydrolase 1 [Candidatus Pelagibacter sp.]
MIKDFKINVSDEQISNINSKIKNYPWSSIEDMEGWVHGTNKNYLKELCEYWVSSFNWKTHQNLINSFSNFKTNVDGIDIHFIEEKGSGISPKPLLLIHGWPGSIVEFLDIIKPLAHPEEFGGKEEDSFTVIVPSLPGFGFSGVPKKPIGPRKIAEIFNQMMTENLKYKQYFAQGGDWGATIANWLGYDHYNSCKGIHINCLTMRHPDGPQTNEEKVWQNKFDNDQIIQDGYRTQQATKPQTLSYAMIDSPVGIAAWITEKIHGWSDLKDDDIESVYSKDILLANIMVYVLTNTFNTAAWIYFGRREEGGRYFPKDFKKIKIPTGIAMFPKEMSEWPPSSYVERIFNVQYISKMKEGGHFPALEKPRLLINDIRKFFIDKKL